MPAVEDSQQPRLALIGATGYIGRHVLDEALDRNCRVTAMVRNVERVPRHPDVRPEAVDIQSIDQIAGAVVGHDAVISCFNPGGHDVSVYPYFYRDIVEGTRRMIEGVRRAGVSRFVYVGGVGSLYLSPGVMAVDDSKFLDYLKQAPDGTLIPEGPPSLDIPLAVRVAFYLMERERELDWTFIAPSLFLGDYGGRTGRLRYGRDEVLMEDGVPAKLDVADLAVATVDEATEPKHHRCRVTVASG